VDDIFATTCLTSYVAGPQSKDIMYRVNESGSNTFKVEYMPVIPG